ncbi:MAG: restriction endonuclease subunit S, partial [Acidobacteriia bacterium]|nr:restriction endonuclease subunit S [Terriglobia bacterium]
DRFSEASGAVAALRRFVLDLAVRGRLVAQDAKDEPAAELLKDIETRIAARKLASDFVEPRSAVEIPLSSLPFTVPASWGWARLVAIADVSYGFAFDSSRFNSSRVGMPLIRIRDISRADTEAYYEGDYDPAYVVQHGDYVVGMDGDFNLRQWRGRDALLNQRVMRIKNWLEGLAADFLAIPLQMILDHLHRSTSLTTVKHLSAKQANGIYLPIPPTAEQRRIVAKVDELTAADVLTFREHVRFQLDHLPRLVMHQRDVHQLREAITNLAALGKLVTQDPADEPALALVNRLKAIVADTRNREAPAPEETFSLRQRHFSPVTCSRLHGRS